MNTEITDRLDRIEALLLPDAYRIQAVALKLDVSVSAVKKLIQRGDLAVMKVNAETRITRESYDRFVRENQTGQFSSDRRRRLGSRRKNVLL